MKKITNLTLLVLISAFVGCNLFNDKTEISNWRGPDRDGIYHETGLLTEWPEEGPELLWKFEELGIGHATVSLISDKLFTAGTIDSITYIFSLDLDGNLLWKKETGPEWMKNFPGVRSTPMIYDDLGYFLNGLGKLFCFNTDNGDFLWEKDLFKDFDGQNITWGITENLLIEGDTLYCTPGGVEANVVALNRITGDIIWKSKGDGKLSSYSSPRIMDLNGKRFLITFTDASIISINLENGELAWKYPIFNKGDSHSNMPLIRNDSVFLLTGYQDTTRLFKVAEDGYSVEVIWENVLLDVGMGDAVLIGDNLYSSANVKGILYSIDWKTGKENYSEELVSKGRLKGSVVTSAEGLLYVYGFTGKFELKKPTVNEFETLGVMQIGGDEFNHWAHPVIKNGRLYIRYDSTLWVYNIKK